MCSILPHRNIDIEELGGKVNRIMAIPDFEKPSVEKSINLLPLLRTLLDVSHNDNAQEHHNQIKLICKQHGFVGKNSYLFQCMINIQKHAPENMRFTQEEESKLQHLLRTKRGRSQSGVLVITVVTSPNPSYTDKASGIKRTQEFTCQWNCHFCPNEPGMPRSYLSLEPSLLRSLRNEFDPVRQMVDRMNALYVIGHPIDKLEVIVLGGTWASYPLEYREEFCRDLYYAANTYWDIEPKRERFDLAIERDMNRSAKVKLIGLTLETRPDTINEYELKLLRSYGCTRVQLGIQHIDQKIMDALNRRCPNAKTIRGIQLLKDNCFKVDAHWMPNLPGSNPAKDREMFVDELLGLKTPIIKRTSYHLNHITPIHIVEEEWDLKNGNFQVDQWKIYPCATVPWTEIAKWYEEGVYKPYSQDQLMDVMLDAHSMMFPWIRINRTIRDIPNDYIITSGDCPNMRQIIEKQLEKEGKCCRCIRCREVKGGTSWKHYDKNNLHFMIYKYRASHGQEYFIALEGGTCTFNKNRVLFGFLRLRIPDQGGQVVFNELDGCALIRELHVYGQLHETENTKHANRTQHTQHTGLGNTLLNIACHIASKQHQKSKLAVISGEGVRNYYQRFGFMDTEGDGRFMILKC